ncbi:TcpD family membrane protein, partial [Streptomyces sp. GSL17-113]|uniref:TcpD family membrane protein n=1 Tax=Streptomyces sp. GSL17-113 TaxID=3115365 RepID=UPI002E7A64DF
CGNVLGIFLAVRGVGYLLKREYGEMITFFVAAIFIGALVWAPDTVKDILTAIWDKIRGA